MRSARKEREHGGVERDFTGAKCLLAGVDGEGVVKRRDAHGHLDV